MTPTDLYDWIRGSFLFFSGGTFDCDTQRVREGRVQVFTHSGKNGGRKWWQCFFPFPNVAATPNHNSQLVPVRVTNLPISNINPSELFSQRILPFPKNMDMDHPPSSNDETREGRNTRVLGVVIKNNTAKLKVSKSVHTNGLGRRHYRSTFGWLGCIMDYGWVELLRLEELHITYICRYIKYL